MARRLELKSSAQPWISFCDEAQLPEITILNSLVLQLSIELVINDVIIISSIIISGTRMLTNLLFDIFC